MTKNRKAQLITVLILGTALGVTIWRKSAPEMTLGSLIQNTARKSDPTPQDAIYGMLDAAREGNVATYLEAYTGQMAVSLNQAVGESTEAGFARYLKESNAAIKGIAITEPQVITDREVKVRVEYVYQDRNEVQFLYLEKTPAGWKIARVDSAERIKTLVPYGTPVK